MKVTQLDCLCVILLHLLHTAGSEKFEVLGPTDSIVAVAGDDIVLPCYLKPNISVEDMTVDWLNLDIIDGRVFRYQNSEIIRDDQIPSYRGRTSLFEEELWRGNTSLKLTRVQGTDEGHYKCLIQSKSWYDDFTVQVLVKAVGSKPVVSIVGHREGGMGLLCESEGWHPEPELVWLNSKGVHLSAGPPEIHRSFKGFYRVKRHVIVQETDTNRFTCRVQQRQINEKMETEIHLPTVGSKPVVSIEGHREGGMGLLCESEGWHPEPELVWLNSKGVHLSAGPPETHRDFNGFYRVKQYVIVQETDTNRFTCRVQQSRINEKMETEIHLPTVGSKPVVSIEGHREGGMGLLCESEGWHPDPELVWLDSKGVHLSARTLETHRDFKGFYRVKQHVIVQETDTNHFTCRVQQKRINEKMETEIHLPSELFDPTPWRMAFIVLCCLGAIIGIGLSLAIYCICYKKGNGEII
ncbi:butyrophilin-like protein 10 isoform X1 [Oncorhynchus mykiss]|uniref:butyrophilin-like protein 10 isoform X1 n=1 Tax=Oncorhynchus mykiss TaxID=8022 RepID=UPI0018786F93|nr:butyrophilin-like protein 10 isoform X1 [Oncorhynchus mykiss]